MRLPHCVAGDKIITDVQLVKKPTFKRPADAMKRLKKLRKAHVKVVTNDSYVQRAANISTRSFLWFLLISLLLHTRLEFELHLRRSGPEALTDIKIAPFYTASPEASDLDADGYKALEPPLDRFSMGLVRNPQRSMMLLSACRRH